MTQRVTPYVTRYNIASIKTKKFKQQENNSLCKRALLRLTAGFLKAMESKRHSDDMLKCSNEDWKEVSGVKSASYCPRPV